MKKQLRALCCINVAQEIQQSGLAGNQVCHSLVWKILWKQLTMKPYMLQMVQETT